MLPIHVNIETKICANFECRLFFSGKNEISKKGNIESGTIFLLLFEEVIFQ